MRGKAASVLDLKYAVGLVGPHLPIEGIDGGQHPAPRHGCWRAMCSSFSLYRPRFALLGMRSIKSGWPTSAPKIRTFPPLLFFVP